MKNTFWHKLKKPFICLAPMEDITDTVFRRMLIKTGRPDVSFTEFTNVEGLFSRGRDSVIHRLDYSPEEQPLVAQIWGTEPDKFRKAAELIKERGFAGVDINMGCPMGKIIKKGACSGLIERRELAKEIFLATREGAGELPVSIKTRIGFKEKTTEDWCGYLLELKPDALTVHGRVAKQLYRYDADWNEIKKAVDLRNSMQSDTVLIGNGDVKTLSEAQERIRDSGVDGVMIGRAVISNLSVFSPDISSFRDKEAVDKLNLFMDHINLFEQTWTGTRHYGVVKKFIRSYLNGFDGAPELRKNIACSESPEEMRKFIRRKLIEIGN